MDPKRHFYVIFFLVSFEGYGQVNKKIREYNRTFQFSVFPGISTNGISSGSYYNSFSLNLLAAFQRAIAYLRLDC